jgi:SAM-dependent methyltransferase
MKDYRTSHVSARISERYEHDVYRKNSYDDLVWRWERRILEREGRFQETSEYLDFACGTGRIIAFFEDRVQRAVGVDIAASMLMLAKAKVHRAELIEADLTRDNVLGGQLFDCITVFRFFLNANPPLREEAMEVLVRLLRDKDSRLIFNVHGNLLSYRFFARAYYRWVRRRDLNTLSPYAAKALAERHGLRVIRWYGFGIIPKPFYRIFGHRLTYAVDMFFARIPGTRWISADLLFVCDRPDAYAKGKAQSQA